MAPLPTARTLATDEKDPANNGAAMVEVTDVSVVLSGRTVLGGVNLEMARGEVVSVIGPSGCGKTTLLNTVAGLLPVTSGSVVVNGRLVTGPGPDRTVVFQEDAVFPWMTVGANVAYPLTLRRADKQHKAETVRELLALVGLEGRENAYPRELSGGMRKRVDLARAFAAEPKVLLMDEPYAALDQMTKQRLQQEFLTVTARNGTTAMFVTHDLEEAIYVADRIVVMGASPGRITEIHQVPFAHPRDPGLRMSGDFQALRKVISDALHANGEPA